jgi:hypothetical protein
MELDKFPVRLLSISVIILFRDTLRALEINLSSRQKASSNDILVL